METGHREESENEKAMNKNDKKFCECILESNKPREACTAKPSQSNGLVGILKVPQLLDRNDDFRPLESRAKEGYISAEPWQSDGARFSAATAGRIQRLGVPRVDNGRGEDIPLYNTNMIWRFTYVLYVAGRELHLKIFRISFSSFRIRESGRERCSLLVPVFCAGADAFG